MSVAMSRCRRARDLVVVAASAGVVVAGARAARGGRWIDIETRVFDAVNGLDQRAHRPAWAAMQLGSLGGSLATGVLVALGGRPRLGRHVGIVGTIAWLGSKAVKPFVGRGRPAVEIARARVLGREQSGLGYPSGHAAVATAMASVVAPHLPFRLRPVVWLGAFGVGATRMYVGAHLPLDIVGGVALGLGTGRVVRLVTAHDA
jgi:undecaprenyl-diphosphatase